MCVAVGTFTPFTICQWGPYIPGGSVHVYPAAVDASGFIATMPAVPGGSEMLSKGHLHEGVLVLHLPPERSRSKSGAKENHIYEEACSGLTHICGAA